MNITVSKKIIFSLLLILTSIFSPIFVKADLLNSEKRNEFNNNVNEIASQTGMPTDNLEDIIGNIIRIVLASLGTVFLILMFWAGNTWMRANGNEEKISKAKNQIASLTIGLIIILAAYAISSWASEILARALTN